MPVPSLAARNVFFVNYVGTDDVGYNAVGAPWSYRSITAALAALALVSNPPSATNPWAIAVGPGVFTEPGLVLPPWVFITGTGDAESGLITTVLLSADLTLASTWQANADQKGGISTITIHAASGTPFLDLTYPAPVSGTPLRQVFLENVTTDLPMVLEGKSNLDRFYLIRLFCDVDEFPAPQITIRHCSAFIRSSRIGQDVVVTDSGGFDVFVRVSNSSLVLLIINQASASVVYLTDVVSFPIALQVTITGTPNIIYESSAYGLGYTPANPSNWITVPTTTQQGLDYLAAGGSGPGAGSNAYATAANNAGNSTVAVTAANYALILTVGGASRTSIIILSTAADPGDRLLIRYNCAIAAVTLEFRNATSGGTLLYTYLSDDAATGTAEFVFTGAAWVALRTQQPA